MKEVDYLEEMMMQPPPEKRLKLAEGTSLDEEVKVCVDDGQVKTVKLEDDVEEIKAPNCEEMSSNEPSIIVHKNLAQSSTTKQNEIRCSICHKTGPEDMEYSTAENQKLLVLLAMIVAGKMSIEEARYCLKKPVAFFYTCTRHIDESRSYLLESLNISHSSEVFGAKPDRIKSLLEIVQMIRGSVFSLLSFKKIIILFTEKYFRPNRNEKEKNDITLDTLLAVAENLEPIAENVIVPKAQRAPRKQVFQKDVDEDLPILATIVKNVEKRTEDPESVRLMKTPKLCAYCNIHDERNRMIRVPKKNRAELWVERLGEEFRENLKKTAEPYICRDHFKPEDFSTRGRLLKGHYPHKSQKTFSFEIQKSDLFRNFEKCDEDDEVLPKTEGDDGSDQMTKSESQ